MDAVLNHVHDQHEYFQDPQKRSWFRTGCICGSPGCDWTDKRLSCLFASYMPDIDWTQTDASEQFISDTLWWLEHFNLDGLRVDAVKHVEDAAIFNLTARIRERFEQAGTRYYLLGETAMGWREGDVTTNQSEYDTIKRYMGKNGLDGQFDFVWYHANSYRVFAYDEKRFLHLDYWTHASLDQFQGSTMVNYLGSHDTSRFLSMATYRDPRPGSSGDRNIANNKWDSLPQQPSDDEPYDRQWLGTLSVFTMPGMPLLYYGDEYGEFGGGDPDNRHMMRLGGQLATREKNQLSRMQKLLTARQKLRGLRRDKLVTVLLGEDVYAYARPDDDPKHGALVILNRLPYPTTASVPIPSELGWATAVTVKDQLSDAGYTVPAAGGRLSVTVPARGGVVLARE
jgi:glycosidase